MVRTGTTAALGLVAGLLLAAHGRASLYSPNDPFALPVGDDGVPIELPFDEFKRRLAVLTNALIEPKPGEPPNPDRQRFWSRIQARPAPNDPAARSLSNAEAAALATDWLRVGRSDQAVELLIPRLRRPDYFVVTVLGHAFATRGDWDNALRYHTEERFELEMPSEVKGLTRPQRDWWQNLDSGYLEHFYRLRKRETEQRRLLSPAELDRASETEDVLPLFPLPTAGEAATPVRFVNEAEQYEPWNLAAAERAKLPPDALAVVQQLLLWFPGETRLYWLLAELYAVADELEAALTIFDECAWSRQYGNRKVLMEHRAAVRAAWESRPRSEEAMADSGSDPPAADPEPPVSLRAIAAYFAVVALVAVIALVRGVVRRTRRGRASPGATG